MKSKWIVNITCSNTEKLTLTRNPSGMIYSFALLLSSRRLTKQRRNLTGDAALLRIAGAPGGIVILIRKICSRKNPAFLLAGLYAYAWIGRLSFDDRLALSKLKTILDGRPPSKWIMLADIRSDCANSPRRWRMHRRRQAFRSCKNHKQMDAFWNLYLDLIQSHHYSGTINRQDQKCRPWLKSIALLRLSDKSLLAIQEDSGSVNKMMLDNNISLLLHWWPWLESSINLLRKTSVFISLILS